MSVRTKIFGGCISLTLVTVFVGYFSLIAQEKLSDTALDIYDRAFQSMNYLRSAQSIVLGISRDIAVGDTNKAIVADQLQSALDALDVARERALSPDGEDLAKRLEGAVSDLQTLFRASSDSAGRQAFQSVEATFDLAVAVYARDGLRHRLSAEDAADRTKRATYSAMIGSLLITLIITMLLSRTIVPSIRQAVTIASAIAAGKLDNQIQSRGSGETGLLLKALATMQASIADKIAFIERLMAQQASTYDVEIASQNVRFETALDHMTLGLRMFDAGNCLVVQNRKFAEMFAREMSLPYFEVHLSAGRRGAERQALFHVQLADGRTIEVSEAAMTGGGRVATYEDITERQRAADRLSHMVRHDALTGLPNRLLFRERLQKMRSGRPDGQVAVFFLDLDRFKEVNDTLGHPVGDGLLCEAARRLLQATGEAGTVARLGGDEFAVIQLAATSRAASTGLATRLIDAMNLPFDLDGNQISIGASIGIAETIDGTELPDDLLKNADLALYAAKADGRGTYRFFEPAMEACIRTRRALELDLRVALAEQQFELYYQPIVAAASGAIVAYEALIRWHHPTRGLVSPGEFIPVAEETGLITAIGVWVLDRACHDAIAWPDEVRLAVNLSPLQFKYRDLVSDVDRALRISGLRPTRLDLEITESLMLQDSAHTLDTLHALRRLGASISMDDFGTGYSALSYLRQFPFEKIKIDRSFIHDMVDSKDGLAIVEAVIRLGHSLRMNVVAEGVETIEQQALLGSVGCQELQGFLFGKPKPAHLLRDLRSVGPTSSAPPVKQIRRDPWRQAAGGHQSRTGASLRAAAGSG